MVTARNCARCGVTHGSEPGSAEMRALRAYALTGDQQAAALMVGLSVATVRNQLARAYCKLGADGAISAFRVLGWLQAPPLSGVTT